jgi:Lon protease-like protein
MRSSEDFPLFPLSIFPVPGQRTGLHIFEARYRLLFEQLESMELIEFGIPFSLNGKLSGYGSVSRLVACGEKDENGHRDVMIQSTDLFRLKRFDLNESNPSHPYPTGSIERIRDWNEWQVQGSALDDWTQMQTLQAQTKEPVQSLISVIEVLQELTPEGAQVNQIVSDLAAGRHPSRLNAMLRFARVVMEQEVQVKRGYFPN